MKKLLFIVITFSASLLYCQEDNNNIEGTVSYVTSQNIYVKFSSTKNIEVGDTLMSVINGKKVPAMVVKNLSSISCVCDPIGVNTVKVGDNVFTAPKFANEIASVVSLEEEVKNDQNVESSEPEKSDLTKDDSPKQDISGRVSVASYSNFSNTSGGDNQRMRYSFGFKADNIGGSKFSIKSNLSFVHSNVNWDEVKKDLFNGLKIYDLSVKYEPVNSFKIWFGRRINPLLSNIGAIDGLQAEKTIKNFSIGAFAGSRPDYRNYGYDFNLFQAGAYVSHKAQIKDGHVQSVISFVDQENNWHVDRRLLYFQHTNNIVKNLFFMLSAEAEMYQNVNDTITNNLRLSNLYLMLRYRFSRKFSISASYRSQSNMIYYYTYRDYINQLTDNSNLQGYGLHLQFRPTNYLSLGLRGNYRYRQEDPKPTRNLYGYLSYNRVPFIDVSATISYTYLETSYTDGNIYNLRISKDLISGKLMASFGYKYVSYQFINYDANLIQNIGNVNLSWRIVRNLSLSASYEGIFESANRYNRLYINAIYRFN